MGRELSAACVGAGSVSSSGAAAFAVGADAEAGSTASSTAAAAGPVASSQISSGAQGLAAVRCCSKVTGRLTPRTSAIRLRSAKLGITFRCASGVLVDGDVSRVRSQCVMAERS